MRSKVRLTRTAIAEIVNDGRAAGHDRIEIGDMAEPGLSLLFTGQQKSELGPLNSNATWYIRSRLDGKQKTWSLGPFQSKLSIDDVRNVAREAKTKMKAGIDPRPNFAARFAGDLTTDKTAQVQSSDLTWGQAVEAYRDSKVEHLEWRAASREDFEKALMSERMRFFDLNNPDDNEVPKGHKHRCLFDQKVSDLTEEDLAKVIRAYEKTTKRHYKKVLNYMRNVCMFVNAPGHSGALEFAIAPTLANVQVRRPRAAQTRIPGMEDARRAYRILTGEDAVREMHPQHRIAGLLSILLVHRIKTIASLKLEYINERNGRPVLELPGEVLKKGEEIEGRVAHVTPLLQTAARLIDQARIFSDGEYLFPVRRRKNERHEAKNPHTSTARISSKMKELCGFTPHDWRRAIRSEAVEEGLITPSAAERLLAHKDTKKAEAYEKRHFIKEKIEALTEWERWLTS